MVRLLEKSFTAGVAVEAAWTHLQNVEAWPTWAKHIRKIELSPPGELAAGSRGTIHLANRIRSTFQVVELEPFVRWKWVGPFLWLAVHYDHRFRGLGPKRTELTFVVEAEGPGAAILGRPFAAVYRRNLDRAVTALVRELESL